MLPSPRVQTPLAFRLEFINEDGSKNRRAIDAAIARLIEREQLQAIGRGLDVDDWSRQDWLTYATARIESCADGERQLWEMRKICREEGVPTVADLLVELNPTLTIQQAVAERGEHVVDHLYRIAVGAPLSTEEAA